MTETHEAAFVVVCVHYEQNDDEFMKTVINFKYDLEEKLVSGDSTINGNKLVWPLDRVVYWSIER